MSVIPQLRHHNPTIMSMRSIRIQLRHETSDLDLAQALQQNPFVTDIVMELEAVQQTAWDSLLHVIATRANLESVKVQDTFITERRNAPAALIRAFLQAIQRNTSIQSVVLCTIFLPTDISTFVDNASSITSFRLLDCDMEQGASRDLAAALQRNTNIESLELYKLNDIYTILILEGLRSNDFLKTFIFTRAYFEPEVSDATSHALQHLLESTTSIQKFELRHATFSERQFSLIAQAIINSEFVSELKFSYIRFEDRINLAQLRGILQNKRNLTSLCFECCDFFGEGQIHRDILSFLSRMRSLLRCFEFKNFGDVDRAFPGVQFKNLLQVIQNCKLLESLKIGTIHSQQQLQTLTESIPSMRIRELDVAFGGQILLGNPNLKHNLLLAIKNNFSLHSVKGKMRNDDLFGTAEDKQTLAFYANRNESLDQWVDNPETIVEQKVWPNALGLAERAGPSALCRGLHSVLETDYVSLKRGRKRKRTQYYTPS